uniref:Uncharacterized protein n=1 Tax=Arundo donax TaxID=35708 RepID=A0A0A8ZJR3_ARUDO
MITAAMILQLTVIKKNLYRKHKENTTLKQQMLCPASLFASSAPR